MTYIKEYAIDIELYWKCANFDWLSIFVRHVHYTLYSGKNQSKTINDMVLSEINWYLNEPDSGLVFDDHRLQLPDLGVLVAQLFGHLFQGFLKLGDENNFHI